MDGRARAPAAGTILNALATGYGSAFAVDRSVTAEVTLGGETVRGRVADHPDADATLIERAVEAVLAEYGIEEGATVETDSEVPIAAGLKSSSAAANAAILATLSAIDEAETLSREAAAKIGVQAAREAGVTITGAFDDASASMLGGVTITDNTADDLLHREPVDWAVAIWVPPEQAFSAAADVERCERIAPVAGVVKDLADEGAYHQAMTINGFAFAAALERPAEPMIEALPAADGVSLSGTGPSYVAVGEPEAVDAVRDRWAERPGQTMRTTTQNAGASVR